MSTEPIAEDQQALSPAPWYRQAGFRLFVNRIVLGAILVVLWESMSGRIISDFWVSSPSKIWVEFLGLLFSGELIYHARYTLTETIIGYFGGAVFGVATGFILARFESAARTLDPYIMALYGIPRIALAPLFIVWFGIGPFSKVVLAGTVVMFLTFFNTYHGIKTVDRDLIQVVRVMGANDRQLFSKIILPAASPWIIAGLKISVPQALVGAIVGEFMAASAGLGYKIQLDSNLFNTTGTMTGILVLAVIVVLGNDILDRVERVVLRWRPPKGIDGSDRGDLN